MRAMPPPGIDVISGIERRRRRALCQNYFVKPSSNAETISAGVGRRESISRGELLP